MNVENILKVADAIEASPFFAMGSWDTCVAGHAIRVANAQDALRSRWSRFWRPVKVTPVRSDTARASLGLDHLTARELFIPLQHIDAMGADRKQAARCLINLAITGKVDWEAAMKPNDPVMPTVPAKSRVVA